MPYKKFDIKAYLRVLFFDQKYRHFVSFHCNDDCVGLEFHNSGTGDESITTIVELDIGIECPDNTQPDSNNYCLTV